MENSILRLFPGFRFHPTDEEVVVHYLKPKIQSTPPPYPIPEAHVCKSNPWSLPGDYQQERYFFSPVGTKRTNRTTPSGHWKPTGIDKQVVDYENNHVGMKKAFVFYISKPKNVSRTDWFMHEYKLATPVQGVQNWVICSVFLKKKAGKDEVVEVRNTMAEEDVSRDFDLNLDGGNGGGGSSSSGTSGVTVAEEDEINSK